MGSPFDRRRGRDVRKARTASKARGEPAHLRVVPPVELDPEVDFPGSIYAVPDPWWGFEAEGRESHPGVCLQAEIAHERALLLKGVSERPKHVNRRDYFSVEPDRINGLLSTTAFHVRPRFIRLRRLALLHDERLMGRVTNDDLVSLRTELARVVRHGLPEEDWL